MVDREQIEEAFADAPRGEVEIMEGEIGEGVIVPTHTHEHEGDGVGPGSHDGLGRLRRTVMGTPLGAKRPPKQGCVCVTDHRPTVVGTDWHHVVPLAWGGPDVHENLVELCPTTHRSLHDLLRWVVREQKWPPRDVLYQFPRYVRALGARAVADAGGIPRRDAIPKSYGGLK
jgi:hypothetical protein